MSLSNRLRFHDAFRKAEFGLHSTKPDTRVLTAATFLVSREALSYVGTHTRVCLHRSCLSLGTRPAPPASPASILHRGADRSVFGCCGVRTLTISFGFPNTDGVVFDQCHGAIASILHVVKGVVVSER